MTCQLGIAFAVSLGHKRSTDLTGYRLDFNEASMQFDELFGNVKSQTTSTILIGPAVGEDEVSIYHIPQARRLAPSSLGVGLSETRKQLLELGTRQTFAAIFNSYRDPDAVG